MDARKALRDDDVSAEVKLPGGEHVRGDGEIASSEQNSAVSSVTERAPWVSISSMLLSWLCGSLEKISDRFGVQVRETARW